MKHLHCFVTLCVVLLIGSFMVQNVTSAERCCVLRGDFNNDGTVNIADLTASVSYLFDGGAPPSCLDHGDVNDDGTVNIADLTYSVAYLFNGGAPPVDCPSSSDLVFTDEYDDGVTYEAFDGSVLDAVQVDSTTSYVGSRSLIVTIPDVDDPAGSYSGGAFTDSSARDLTVFNALTFWAKATKTATLDVAGIGNDNTGTSMYTAQVNGLSLTTDWQQYVIPFPEPSRLSEERGLYFFAEGPEEGLGYEIWMDEIVFDSLGTITNPRPSIPTQTIDVEVGENVSIGNGSVTFDVGGTDVVVSAMPGYFTFFSSDQSTVSVAGDGTITAVGVGTAAITATLGGTAATGTVTVNVSEPQAEPTTPAPAPTPDPADVLSLFSDEYTAATTVDTWSAGWDQADVEDFLIGTDSTKKYTNLVFAGIEFASSPLDATAMTHFHMDVWTPEETAAPAVFKVKLVDFGADGAFGGGDDVEHELTFDENTTETGTWFSIDVPLASFTNLVTTGHLAQMVISGDLSTVYVDNVFFYDAGLPTAPPVAAPTPTEDPAYVTSLYSDAYSPATTVDTWSAVWDQADVTDYVVDSDSSKNYTNLVFAGVEFTSSPLDASSMTYFHMDVWTPVPTDAPAVYTVKLVDFGADGSYGGGDDSEHEIAFDETTTETGTWFSIDVPLTDFTNLNGTSALAQMVISGDLGTIFVDNIYFYKDPPTEPTSPAPTPGQDPSDVVSLYSDAYTPATTIDTWSAVWDQADVEDFVVDSDSTKKYTNLVYAGVEFTSNTVDASTMTHFHMDVWTPDATAAPAVFKVKLVDFGADGAYDGGDDVEHELTFDENTMNTGSWVSIDVPMTDFANLTTRAHLAQMIISADPNTVFVDNIYFYDAGTQTEPTSAAPTPSVDPGNVISLLSDAYTDVTVDTWSAGWDQADVTDVVIDSDNAKMYTSLVYAGIEFTSSTIDASAMTHFHMDVWTPDATDAPAVFSIKLVDFGANGVWDGGGDDVEHEITLDETTMNTGSWVSIELPLSDFTGLTTRAHLAQLVITSDPNTVYIDNVYLHN